MLRTNSPPVPLSSKLRPPSATGYESEPNTAFFFVAARLMSCDSYWSEVSSGFSIEAKLKSRAEQEQRQS